MDRALKEQLIYAMLRFRKVGMDIPGEFDVRIGELFVLNGIAEHSIYPVKKVNVSDIHCNLHFTKPAVSQILNALEKKGYVSREIDKDDRRRIAVTLTPDGKEILSKTKEYTDQRIEKIISRFGEENTKELIRLFNLLSDISEDLKREGSKESTKGESNLD
jgi:DNA-binding MarR family transcriptional regulator